MQTNSIIVYLMFLTIALSGALMCWYLGRLVDRVISLRDRRWKDSLCAAVKKWMDEESMTG